MHDVWNDLLVIGPIWIGVVACIIYSATRKQEKPRGATRVVAK